MSSGVLVCSFAAGYLNEALSVLMLCVPVFYIYIQQLSSFRAPTLWFIHLTVTTCHIQYTFLSLCQFISRENGQNRKIHVLEVLHFCMTWKCLPTFLYDMKMDTKHWYWESFFKVIILLMQHIWTYFPISEYWIRIYSQPISIWNSEEESFWSVGPGVCCV